MRPVWEYVEDPTQINAVLLIGRQWLPISKGSWTVEEKGEVVAFQTGEGNAFVRGSAVLGVREETKAVWDPPLSEEGDSYEAMFGGTHTLSHPFPKFVR